MTVIRDETDVALYQVAIERFPDERHHRDVRGGVELLYVDGETVISKLNETFGLFGWAFDILADGIHEEADEAWCRGRLTIYKQVALATSAGQDGEVSGVREVIHAAVREQYGSQKIKRSRSSNRPLDIGFDKKGAATDCLKKCASLVGIALYLWNKEEAAMLKWQLNNARAVDSTVTNAASEPAVGVEPAAMAGGRPPATNGQAAGRPSGGLRRPAGRGTTAPPSGEAEGGPVINGRRMPPGFEAPFAIVNQQKSRWQCRAEDCEAVVDAEAEYRVGTESRTGQYVLERAREEAGAVLCVVHMAAWYRAKQLAGGAVPA
jgi:hypothetical protein